MTGRAFAAALVVLAMTGCQNESNFVTVQTGRVIRAEVVGTYDAIEMSATLGGATTDVLAAGGSLVLTLDVLVNTSGRLIAPGLGPDGGNLDQDLAGTWTFNPITGVVNLALDEESFVGAITYESSRTADFLSIRLSGSAAGDESDGIPTIDLVLERR
jgi:hypothetical protein